VGGEEVGFITINRRSWSLIDSGSMLWFFRLQAGGWILNDWPEDEPFGLATIRRDYVIEKILKLGFQPCQLICFWILSWVLIPAIADVFGIF